MHGSDPILSDYVPADAERQEAAAPPLPPPAAPSPLQRELLRKMELEAAMVASPHDQALRASYFELLLQFAVTRTGLSHALLPELGHPLYFRCGSTDAANMAQIFRDNAYGFAMRATPLRILDLGAYAGYAAVYLARRFPHAQVACVEPCDSNFRMLTLNTTPYRRIRTIQAAAWHSTTRLGVQARYFGDWGTQLQDGLPDADCTIQAHSVADLLTLVGWSQADFIKCDIEGSELAVFADPTVRWLEMLDVLAIETHDTIQAGCSDAVAACFDPLLFEKSRHGEVELYQRRTPLRAMVRLPPRELHLINGEPGLFPLALQDVSRAAWGFFTFDGDSCQLHPNLPGEKPARVIFPRTLDGHRRFVATLHHAGYPAAAISFTLIVQREDGSEVLRAEHALSAGERTTLSVALPSLTGRHRFILQTEMAAGAPHNFNAWARWLAPRVA
jgi:FkbM family methyltransferase